GDAGSGCVGRWQAAASGKHKQITMLVHQTCIGLRNARGGNELSISAAPAPNRGRRLSPPGVDVYPIDWSPRVLETWNRGRRAENSAHGRCEPRRALDLEGLPSEP